MTQSYLNSAKALKTSGTRRTTSSRIQVISLLSLQWPSSRSETSFSRASRCRRCKWTQASKTSVLINCSTWSQQHQTLRDRRWTRRTTCTTLISAVASTSGMIRKGTFLCKMSMPATVNLNYFADRELRRSLTTPTKCRSSQLSLGRGLKAMAMKLNQITTTKGHIRSRKNGANCHQSNQLHSAAAKSPMKSQTRTSQMQLTLTVT